MHTKLKSVCFFFFFASCLLAQPAPDFTVTDAEGHTHRLYDNYLNMGKTVLIELFFTTCPPCNSIAPSLQQLYVDWGEGQGDVQFIGLSILGNDTDAKIQDYDQRHGLTFPAAGGEGGGPQAAQVYRDGTYGFYIGTPTFVIIAPDGSVNYGVRENNNAATIAALDAAIEATGAGRPEVLTEVSGVVRTFTGRAMPGVKVYISGDANNFDITDNKGQYSISTSLEAGATYQMLAEKNATFNTGVSTLDMVFLQKHILNIDTFENVYQHIIGDGNNSQSNTTLDMVVFRKVILRVENSLPNRTTPWLFLKPNLPLHPSDTRILFTTADNLSAVNITGIKFGDLNDNVPLD